MDERRFRQNQMRLFLEIENWIVGVGYYKFGSIVIRIENPTIGVRHYKCRTADSPEL